MFNAILAAFNAKTQRLGVSALKTATLVLIATPFTVVLSAQTPAMERVTLDEAVRRALAGNPSIAQAAEAVLRAEGLLQQARAATMPAASAFFNNATLDSSRTFNGVVTQPRNQSTISAT